MTEHVCRWEFDAGDDWAECGCGKELHHPEIAFRLNEYETLKKATERLSAEDAKLMGDQLGGHGHQMEAMILRAYADILEGK